MTKNLVNTISLSHNPLKGISLNFGHICTGICVRIDVLISFLAGAGAEGRAEGNGAPGAVIGVTLTEIGLSGERKFCCSRCAHML